jgi:hypothetical protein
MRFPDLREGVEAASRERVRLLELQCRVVADPALMRDHSVLANSLLADLPLLSRPQKQSAPSDCLTINGTQHSPRYCPVSPNSLLEQGLLKNIVPPVSTGFNFSVLMSPRT